MLVSHLFVQWKVSIWVNILFQCSLSVYVYSIMQSSQGGIEERIEVAIVSTT